VEGARALGNVIAMPQAEQFMPNHSHLIVAFQFTPWLEKH
jgi:hypothetical protein